MEDGVELVGVRNSRQQPGAGPSAPGPKPAAGGQRTASGSAARRRANLERQQQDTVIDLTASDQQDSNQARAHDEDVTITEVRAVKRARRPAVAAGPAAARPGGAGPSTPSTRGRAAAAAQAPPPPPPPPSPKGYKCVICHERMEADLATTTCGHMFCYTCILPWIQKSANCPTCRTKLTKTKIIRIYPPT